MKNGPEKFFLLLLVGISFLQMLYFWPLMPETMASHFDGMGKANGFAPRAGFFALYAGLIALFFLVFLILPRQLGRLPDRLINLPNKNFWLALERRESTFAVIEKQIVRFGSATLILIIITMQLVFQANRSGAAGIPGKAIWVLLALYLIFSLAWTINFVRRFGKPR
jgi:uncharacterized membrane protein